jgi:hypothetical protein
MSSEYESEVEKSASHPRPDSAVSKRRSITAVKAAEEVSVLRMERRALLPGAFSSTKYSLEGQQRLPHYFPTGIFKKSSTPSADRVNRDE